jgi:hypothetical protein
LIKLTIEVLGSQRVVAPEVFLKHATAALRGVSLCAGTHTVEIDRDGGVWLNGEKLFTPARPRIAGKGAA